MRIEANFIIRAGHIARAVCHAGEDRSVREVADSMRPVTYRKIELTERRHPRRSNQSARIKHPDRTARSARVAISAKQMKLFSRAELDIMTNAPSNKGLPLPKTIHLALLHIARLGGHIRNNGHPGWQTLAWGYEKLLTLRLGWEIAMASKCDQS